MNVRKISLLLLLVIALGAVYGAYNAIMGTNIKTLPKTGYIYIAPETSYDALFEDIKRQELLKSPFTFDKLAGYMNYKRDIVPSGKYALTADMSNIELIRKLRARQQESVNLTFNNARLIADLSGKLAENIYLDSITINNHLSDSNYIKKFGYTPETLMTLFIPNTYKVYWGISMDQLMQRMQVENDKFWTEERLVKANKLNLTPQEVYILASIVDKESLKINEKPIIAGVYLNRLERGIALQADPTVVFANGDFGIRRVLNRHLAFDSPYNTYMYAGLPPGPIGMASISGLKAVLDPSEHEYIYFCAKPGYDGSHAFAKTLREHNNNARRYQRWLNQQGIR